MRFVGEFKCDFCSDLKGTSWQFDFEFVAIDLRTVSKAILVGGWGASATHGALDGSTIAVNIAAKTAGSLHRRCTYSFKE